MKITVFAHLSPERMYDQGRKAGLSEQAADFFRFFTEVKLELDVTEETGAVTGCRVVE